MECDKCFTREKDLYNVRQPGVEPGSTAWEAAMITVTPLSPTRHFFFKVWLFISLLSYSYIISYFWPSSGLDFTH